MSTITCACPHCAEQTSATYDEYYDDLSPEDEEWTVIEGQWYCPWCSDYTVDEYGDSICACQFPQLDWGPVYQDARGHYSLARDDQGRVWRIDYDDPSTSLPYLWEDDEDDEEP
jgi:hypothetical protein